MLPFPHRFTFAWNKPRRGLFHQVEIRRSSRTGISRILLVGVCAFLPSVAVAELYRIPATFYVQLVQVTSQPTRDVEGEVAWNQGPEDTMSHFADVPRVVLRSEVQRPFPERITVVLAVMPEDKILHSAAVAMTHEGDGSYSAKAATPEEKATLITWAAKHWQDFVKEHVVLERVDGAPDWSQAATTESGTSIRIEIPGALPVPPYPIKLGKIED